VGKNQTAGWAESLKALKEHLVIVNVRFLQARLSDAILVPNQQEGYSVWCQTIFQRN